MAVARLPIGMVTYSISRLRIIEKPYYDTVSWNDGNNHATLTGRSRVTAAVFGGGRHIWRLQFHFNLSMEEGR